MTPIALREDFASAGVRCLAWRCDDAAQVRRLLSIAAVYDGMSRAGAALTARCEELRGRVLGYYNSTAPASSKAEGEQPSTGGLKPAKRSPDDLLRPASSEVDGSGASTASQSDLIPRSIDYDS